SPIRKFDNSAMPAWAKACGQYINSARAVNDAQRRGFDEAILLNSQGLVAEGSGENLFVVKNRALITTANAASTRMRGSRAPARGSATCPAVPDHRDHHWEAPRSGLRGLPTGVDLRRRCPPVYNQGPLNSCSAHALAAAIWFAARTDRPGANGPSRLFIYYNER